MKRERVKNVAVSLLFAFVAALVVIYLRSYGFGSGGSNISANLPISPTLAMPTGNIVASQHSSDAVFSLLTAREFDKAVRELEQLDDRERVSCLRKGVIAELSAHQRYSDIDRICRLLTNRRPGYTADLGFLLHSRTEALIGLRSYKAALQEAKRYYNVCTMRETADAMLSVHKVLVLLDRHAEAARFRDEQSRGYNSEKSLGHLSVLSSIELDDNSYPENGLEISGGTANRLLLLDRTSEAIQMFRELDRVAKTTKERAVAVSGMARSLKAQDGAVGLSNAYLRDLTDRHLASLSELEGDGVR